MVLFWYVYFSCNKLELVRSKLGIALSAVFTVLGAVTMSLGMSGVSLNIHSKVTHYNHAGIKLNLLSK